MVTHQICADQYHADKRAPAKARNDKIVLPHNRVGQNRAET